MLTHWLPLLTYSLLSLMPLKMFSINIMQHLKYNWRCSEQPLTSELSESGTKKTNGILRFSSKHQNEEFMGPLLGHRLTAPDSLLWREGWSVWHAHLARTSKVATGQMEFLGEKKAWLKVKGDRDAEKRKNYSYLLLFVFVSLKFWILWYQNSLRHCRERKTKTLQPKTQIDNMLWGRNPETFEPFWILN